MKRVTSMLLLVLILGPLWTTAHAAENLVGKVLEVTLPLLQEPTPTVTFRLDTGTTLCPAGYWYVYEFRNIEEAKAGYAALLTAIAANKKVAFAADPIEGTGGRCKTTGVRLTAY